MIKSKFKCQFKKKVILAIFQYQLLKISLKTIVLIVMILAKIWNFKQIMVKIYKLKKLLWILKIRCLQINSSIKSAFINLNFKILMLQKYLDEILIMTILIHKMMKAERLVHMMKLG